MVTGPQTHAGRVTAVHDGDTITVAVVLAGSRGADADLGFHVYREKRRLVLHAPIRLLGCNARELHDDGGVEARDNLAALVLGQNVLVRSVAADKFARWDASIQLPDGRDLVTVLLADGWVAPWNGQGVKPSPPWPRVPAT